MQTDPSSNAGTTAAAQSETLDIKPALRPLIAESWRRSQAAGVVTTAEAVKFYRVDDDDLQRRQQASSDVIKVARPHLNWLSEWLAGTPHIVYLVDQDGIVLFSTGDYDNADAFGLTPGYDWSERTMGTNGAGTAIAANRPVAVFGPEHISEPFRGFTCMGAPLHDPDGQVCGAIDVSTSAEDAHEERLAVMAYIAFMIDTELAHLRAAAVATQRMKAKDRLLAEVSHELRTPLSVILGWARLLRKTTGDETSLHALEIIERNAVKQAQVIEDLVDLSRCLAGELRLKRSETEVAPLIKNSVDSLQQTLQAKRQALKLDLAVDGLTVQGDPVRLEQVVSNLVSNAIKYTPEGGFIGVKLEKLDSHAAITVSDTGVGINKDLLPLVFEYFRRGNDTSTARHEGLGLGLAIVREIVTQHGGTVDAQSQGEGQGATFRVLLPLCNGN
ncbi:MAG TPA: ATP-binding protein [Pyrinomonadaceae bacterium]|nr:ATP-binding protein [Pyrinomonadaceae bacterium]